MAELPETLRALDPADEMPVGVLLVDDNPANLLSLHVILDEATPNLTDALSGEEAIRLAAVEQFAVILLDVQMPGIDGFETARRLRSSGPSKHTPIIFLTANDIDAHQFEVGYSLGAVDVLVKPIAPFILRAKVRGFVELFQEQQRAKHEAEQLRLLVHGTTEYAIFMLDPAGRVLTWNLGAERLKGYKAEEIIGSHFSRFYPQEAIQRNWPAQELTAARSEGRFEDEGWRLRKDGSHFWANVVITALYDEQGDLRGFSKVTRDLTGRKNAEEALRESEERFRLLVESARDYAIFLLDPQGYVVTWNAGAERIKQYRADEIIGRHFSQFYPQEATDRGWPAHELAMAQQEGRFEDEGWRVRRDGSMFWANVIITALYDDSGSLRGFSKITRDMTDRKRAEDASRHLLEEAVARRVAEQNAQLIEEQRERLRITLSSIGDAVISADAAGRIVFLNPAAEALVGWTAKEAISRSISEVFQIVDEDTRRQIVNPALLALEGRDVELKNHTVLISKQGSERPIDHSAAPIRDAQSNVVGSVLVFRDIGPLKKLNNYLRDADRRKDEFLATLAHELRNPLAPIRNALQILKLPEVDATTIDQAREVMERQVDQLVRLVDDLLDVSRVMRGKIELRRERLELASVVARAIETAQPLIEAQGHRLKVSLPEGSLLLDADPVRLTQIIGNLLTNAAKYTEINGHIWLTAERTADEVVLRIRDDGIGIAPEILPHVFDLFVQADHASIKAQGGLGIGLTLVKNLVGMHKGVVSAFSEGLGKGAEFVVRLPIAAEALPEAVAKNGGGRERVRPSGYRLLIVDDNKDAALTLSMLLRMQGHDVEVAYNGPDALNLAGTHRPDLVFLDIGMPLMDGFEVARRLRATSGLEATTLVALTGWGQREDRRKTTEAGFDHHLVKPPNSQAIEDLLSEMSKRQ